MPTDEEGDLYGSVFSTGAAAPGLELPVVGHCIDISGTADDCEEMKKRMRSAYFALVKWSI